MSWVHTNLRNELTVGCTAQFTNLLFCQAHDWRLYEANLKLFLSYPHSVFGSRLVSGLVVVVHAVRMSFCFVFHAFLSVWVYRLLITAGPIHF